jgi:hypothetical protein
MNLWDITMDGPTDSVYSVRLPSFPSNHPPQLTHTLSLNPGRQIQHPNHTPQRIPLQTTDPLLQNQNLPPQRLQRRARRNVSRDVEERRMETSQQNLRCVEIGEDGAGESAA